MSRPCPDPCPLFCSVSVPNQPGNPGVRCPSRYPRCCFVSAGKSFREGAPCHIPAARPRICRKIQEWDIRRLVLPGFVPNLLALPGFLTGRIRGFSSFRAGGRAGGPCRRLKISLSGSFSIPHGRELFLQNGKFSASCSSSDSSFGMLFSALF